MKLLQNAEANDAACNANPSANRADLQGTLPMIRSLWIAKTGLDAQQTQHRRHLQQPRQRQHQRLQARARGVRGPAVPDVRQPGAQSSQQTQLPSGLQSAPACGRSRPSASSPRATCSRPATRSTSRSTGGASSRSSCPTAPPATRATARSRSMHRASSSPLSGFALQPAITIPANALSDHDRPATARSR